MVISPDLQTQDSATNGYGYTKDSKGTKVEKGFIEAVSGGGARQKKAKRRVG